MFSRIDQLVPLARAWCRWQWFAFYTCDFIAGAWVFILTRFRCRGPRLQRFTHGYPLSGLGGCYRIVPMALLFAPPRQDWYCAESSELAQYEFWTSELLKSSTFYIDIQNKHANTW